MVLRLEHASEPRQAAAVPTEPGSAGLRGGLGTGGLDRATGVSDGQPDGEALVRELARISGPKPYKPEVPEGKASCCGLQRGL